MCTLAFHVLPIHKFELPGDSLVLANYTGTASDKPDTQHAGVKVERNLARII